jgi:rhodanese-related sulfurtransferase
MSNVRSQVSSLLLACTLLLPSQLLYGQFESLFGPKIDTISTSELGKLLEPLKGKKPGQESNFVLVDVRSDEEVAVSVIPGAITKKQFERDKDKYAGKLVIPYCTVGGRSAKYAEQLVKQGARVKNYKGSILEWVKAEKPLITLDDQPTNRVHIYSDRYKIPAKYEPVTK